MSKETIKPAASKKTAQSRTSAPKTASKKTASTATGKRPAAVKAKPPAKAASKTTSRKSSTTMTAKPTVIAVEADVGFGNQLFIRGEGAGLSWDRGVPMECKASDRWEWSTPGTDQSILFKILINDQLWSHGENFEAEPGKSTVVTPDF